MPKSMRVKTRFEADDDISKVARRIEKNVDRMNRRMQKGFKQTTRASKSFLSSFKGNLAAMAVSKGFDLLGQGVQEVSRQFVDFEHTVTGAAARFKDVDVRASNFTEKLKKLKTEARRIAEGTTFNATQVAAAFDFFARAGFKMEEGIKATIPAINLAIATGEDFNEVADWSSDLLGAFGLSVKDSGQKIKNYVRLVDNLTLASNSANVRVENMFETLKDVGPIATQLFGSRMEELFAATMALGDAGLKGTKAMTGLRGILLAMTAPGSEAARALKLLNVQAFDAATGKPRKIVDVMRDLKNALNGLNKQAKNQVMKLIFGKVPLASAAVFLRDVEKINDNFNKLRKAEGIAQDVTNIMGTTMQSELNKLGSAFLEFGFTFLEPWEEDMKTWLRNSINMTREATKSLKKLQKEQEQRAFIDRETRGGLTKAQTEALSRGFGLIKPRQPIIPANIEGARDVLGRPLLSFEQDERKREGGDIQKEMLKMFQAASPIFNIGVNQKISSEEINVETVIDAPGASGKVVKNNF